MQGHTGVEIRDIFHDVLDVLLGRQNGGSAPPAPTDTPLVPVTKCPTFAGLLKPHAPLVQVFCDFEPSARGQPSPQNCTAARHVDMSHYKSRSMGSRQCIYCGAHFEPAQRASPSSGACRSGVLPAATSSFAAGGGQQRHEASVSAMYDIASMAGREQGRREQEGPQWPAART